MTKAAKVFESDHCIRATSSDSEAPDGNSHSFSTGVGMLRPETLTEREHSEREHYAICIDLTLWSTARLQIRQRLSRTYIDGHL